MYGGVSIEANVYFYKRNICLHFRDKKKFYKNLALISICFHNREE